MLRSLALLLTFTLTCGLAPADHSARAPEREVRALWVARTTLTSPAAINRMIEAARASGFNTLLVQVRARGDAYYASRIEPRAEALADQPSTFDPLRFTLTEATRVGLHVHAWLSVNLVSSAVDLPASRTHVVYRHPEWLMVPRKIAGDLRGVDPQAPAYLARIARQAREDSGDVEGIFFSPVDPAAANYLAAVVDDLVARYGVDGVHLDYVRYPNEDFDYSRRALSLFAAEIEHGATGGEQARLRARAARDPVAYAEHFAERWREFRRARLTALVARLRAVVKARRPEAVVSAAVVPDPEEASEHRMQDWTRWAANGLIDVVCPMAYAAETAAFTAQLRNATRAAGARPVWAGIGAYRLSPAQTIESIQVARRLGTDGIVLFSYDSLIASSPGGGALSQIGRGAFERPHGLPGKWPQ